MSPRPRRSSPFSPSFGVTPPVLVGREAVIDEFGAALDDGPGALGRATLYTGARGAGKTVLLNAVEEEARRRGWLVVAETASPGFVERIANEHLPALLQRADPHAARSRLTGLTAPFNLGGASWETVPRHVVSQGLRSQVALLADTLAEHETGLLITLDEVHAAEIQEMRELATVIQHAFRENRDVAFAGAGLRSAVESLLNDDVLTFLRRADRHHLGSVSSDDVREALVEPIRRAGRDISEDAAIEMARATNGYPFLIQLVGDLAWKRRPDTEEIGLLDAREAVLQARRRLGRLVHEPALANASDVDRSFLVAMAVDDGPSRMADIVRRLGVSDNYAQVYRSRLIAADLVFSPRRGRLDFTLPYLREYLREHAASDFHSSDGFAS